jgi:hypothetical protein
MNSSAGWFCVALLLCALATGACNRQAADPSTAQQADAALLAAVAGNDAASARPFLDDQFEWTDSAGLTRSGAESLTSLSALSAAVQGETGAQFYSYDQLEVVTGTRPSSRFLRVWARRPQGWRLFTMIDTPMVTGTPPFSVPITGQQPDCDNPCRNIPFTPQTPAQQEMLDTFMRLKVDEWHPNPDDWAPYVLDDVYYFTSAAAMSKADRVARLAQQRDSGAVVLPGDPVLSMRIAEFGPAAVMFARHAPYRGGKPFYSVRVWAFRDGMWRFANSAQTTIEAADPLPPVQPRS